MRVLSIDPGQSGAVVLMGPEGLQVRRDFKHPEDIAKAATEFAPFATVALVELVAARPGQGVVSMFSFGQAGGVALGALYAGGFSVLDPERKPLLEVLPWTWKKYIRALTAMPPEEEFDSRAIARRLMPHAGAWLLREKDHNTADALLMGIWYVANKPAIGNLRARDKLALKRANKKPRS